ncbi:MAG: SGNH/GDSL hydrolase family protein [Candidatus Wallbacteria bacterium]|nr:SGNH/GDSL hydrolase family protein [Candidatus Wallbacteria bacterium]
MNRKNLQLLLGTSICCVLMLELLLRCWPLTLLWNNFQIVEMDQGMFSNPSIPQKQNKVPLVKTDPVLGYMRNLEHSSFNELGIYGKNILPVRDDNSFRILLLGDSVSDPIGGSSNPPSGYPFLLEEILNRRGGKKIVVMNASVVGYNTMQEVEYFKRYGIWSAPDLVLLAYVNNDMWPPVSQIDLKKGRNEAWQMNSKPVPGLYDLGPANDFLLEHLISLRVLFLELWKFQSLKGKLYRNRIELYYPDKAANLKSLEEIIGICRSNRIKFAIIHFPVLADFADYEKIRPEFEYHRILRNLTTELKVPYLDLLDRIRNLPERELVKPEDYKTQPEAPTHLSPAGHAVVAAEISDFLCQEKLVP